MEGINRRDFIRMTGGAASLLWLPTNATGSSEATLKAFIVSDSHFGWDGKDQPTPEVQQQAMKTILARFPNLDLFVDTGDAHHGNAKKPSWEKWMDVIGVELVKYETGIATLIVKQTGLIQLSF